MTHYPKLKEILPSPDEVVEWHKKWEQLRQDYHQLFKAGGPGSDPQRWSEMKIWREMLNEQEIQWAPPPGHERWKGVFDTLIPREYFQQATGNTPWKLEEAAQTDLVPVETINWIPLLPCTLFL